jgi:hypothetical protein
MWPQEGIGCVILATFNGKLKASGIAGQISTLRACYESLMRKRGGFDMYRMLRLTVAAMAVAFASLPSSVLAQVPTMQIKLTEKHLEAFIAAQKDMSAVVEKMMENTVSSNVANARYEAELKTVTKKHGFRNFAEYEAVAANISLVMSSIDSQTKIFIDPPTALKKELEDVSAAKDIPAHERKQLLRSLTLALRAARPIQFPSNVELVQKYYDQIYVTTIVAHDDDSWRNSRVVRAIGE